MLFLDFFRLYPVPQSYPREEADIGAITGTAQGKSLISSSSGGELAISATGASVPSSPLITSVPYFPLQIAQKGNIIK